MVRGDHQNVGRCFWEKTVAAENGGHEPALAGIVRKLSGTSARELVRIARPIDGALAFKKGPELEVTSRLAYGIEMKFLIDAKCHGLEIVAIDKLFPKLFSANHDRLGFELATFSGPKINHIQSFF